jgi:hypothetical protein
MPDSETYDPAEKLIKLLQVAGVAEAAGEPLDIESLAPELGASVSNVREKIEHLEGIGLLFSGLDEGLPPMLRDAGRQFLERGGHVPHEVLRFLPRFIDDLYGREALLHAGTALVDEFRYQLLNGDAVDHAAHLVPSAFAEALDERLALDLFAATVALMVRLSDEKPACCVAEEIMAVGLLDDARAWLKARYERQELTEVEAASAADALGGLFELFEDNDVLEMFEMREPSDAALAEHDPLNRQFGVVDQRIESWFKPFGWAIPTGYIGE